MAWLHFKAATESDLYDGQGSYKNIMYRIASLVRKDGQEHAGWCTASEKYIAQTTGFSERQVQRAVEQFKKDGVFAVRTYRRGGRKFNHYKPNTRLFDSRKRKLEPAVLVSEFGPGDTVTDEDEGTRHDGGWPTDTVSNPTRQDGGVVGIATEVKNSVVNAFPAICKTELRSDSNRLERAVSTRALTGKNYGGCAPEPPLVPIQYPSSESLPSESGSSTPSTSPLVLAAETARSKQEMLAVSAQREPLPPPPSKEALTPPPSSGAGLRTTPYQVAKALVEETQRNAWDTYLRAYSLAHQLAGYLEERAARGEKAYTFDKWEVMYAADFIDAINCGWKFKDLEDAIDVAQTTKLRFVCCTPRRLLDKGESLMKQVYALRRKAKTLRQRLGEKYPSWYFDNADSLGVQEMKRAVDDEVTSELRGREEECQRERELDDDIPIRTLKTTGQIKCINPDCPYRFDTRDQMHRHFDDCWRKAMDDTPVDPEDALEEEMEDAYDDHYGVIPCSYYPWYEEDEKAGRWDKYAAENADFGAMFNPWEETAKLTRATAQ